ncbi:MAG TPA: type II secretion system protein GspJ [Kofleriaceae bacterium]|nr:type II secretion system protein GspJ [Kofleriaceae bacterium]
MSAAVRPAPRRAQAGLTLVELLIAMAIMALMMMLAWSTITNAGESRTNFEAIEDRNNEVRVAMSRMVHDLESAYLSTNENKELDNRRTLMKGKDDELTFSTFAHTALWADANESDQSIVVYSIDQDRREPGKRSLFRRELRRPSNEKLEDEPAELDVLLRDVESVKFEYWDWKEKEWKDTWDTTKQDAEKDRLPVRVRITLEYKNPRGDKLKLSTQAHLLLQEQILFAN